PLLQAEKPVDFPSTKYISQANRVKAEPTDWVCTSNHQKTNSQAELGMGLSRPKPIFSVCGISCVSGACFGVVAACQFAVRCPTHTLLKMKCAPEPDGLSVMPTRFFQYTMRRQ
ncbi:unnamed protein product, partial [Ectocarpus fasciculatus]